MDFNVFVVMMVCGLLVSALVFWTYQSATKAHAMNFAVASNVAVFFLIAAVFEKSLAIKWGVPVAFIVASLFGIRAYVSSQTVAASEDSSNPLLIVMSIATGISAFSLEHGLVSGVIALLAMFVIVIFIKKPWHAFIAVSGATLILSIMQNNLINSLS